MGLQFDMLNKLCPLHLVLDPDGKVLQCGPTMGKLGLGLEPGAFFLSALEINRPKVVQVMADLHAVAGRPLHVKLKGKSALSLKGSFVPAEDGGGVLDLSFGIFVQDLVADHHLTSRDFSPTDMTVEVLYLIEANNAALAASRRLNGRLQTAMFAAEERALTDMLTGLSNRRAMELVQGRLHRAGQEYALMHLDLDFFKEVNDTKGHAAGDAVLRSVSKTMLGQIRREDTVARIGGDEFVIIFPNPMTDSRLGDLADRLITGIEQPIKADGITCQVSASIGITRCQDLSLSPEVIMEQADVALYAAKNAGRGQFSHYHFNRSSDQKPVQKRGK